MKSIIIDPETLFALDLLNVDYKEWNTVYKSTPLLDMWAFGIWIFIWSGFGTFTILYFSNLL